MDIHKHIHRCNIKLIEVNFLWVPSHIGIIGNEAADEAANLAHSSKSTPYALPISTNQYYSRFHKRIRHQHNIEIETNDSPSVIWTNNISKHCTKFKANFNNRLDEVRIFRLICHRKSKEMDCDPHLKCNLCDEPFTFTHYLISCNAQHISRTTSGMLDLLSNDDHSQSHTHMAHVILAKDKDHNYKHILKFISLVGFPFLPKPNDST